MKIVKKFMILCLILILTLTYSFVPSSVFADSVTFAYEQNGAEGATIICSSDISYVAVDDPALVEPVISKNSVTLKRVGSSVGVAEVTVASGDSSVTYEIPVGYTTFIFDGDRVTVYPGSDSNYEIIGIDDAGAEITVTSSLNDEKFEYYENTDVYSLSVEIKKNGGSYVFAGESDNMSIAVKKTATADASLLLCGLDLSSGITSPVTVRKNSSASVTITALEGHENILQDAAYNNADNYADNALAESAVVKAKAYSNIKLNGKGTLNLLCNTKNALKIGEYGNLTIEELNLNIKSVKNGISSDNTMLINSGTININSEADAIRSDPDAVDADNGCAGTITIKGGNINITTGSDGIQAAQDLMIYGGVFDIKTGGGYNDKTFDPDSSSAKGLKASYSSDSEDTDMSDATNKIYINGGTFNLNTADDAVHSDAYIIIEGGDFTIYTGDDAVHADTSLDLGISNASDCSVHMDILSCYEGLEAGNLYIYSGCYNIISSDDGINAAGGSDASDNGGTGFKPGGGSMSGGGTHGGSFGGGSQGGNSGTGSSTADYSINIYGGTIFVNAQGDGIDSNGNLNITGGTHVVWGGSAPENPLDYDGNFYINGAAIFAAGSNQMAAKSPISGSQSYQTFSSNISKGKTITVKEGNDETVSLAAPKSVSYVFYSSPALTSSNGSISSSTSVANNIPVTDAEHNFAISENVEATCTKTGLITYKCEVCGAEKTETVPSKGHNQDTDYEKYKIDSDVHNHTAECNSCGGIIFAMCEDNDRNEICDICGADLSEDNDDSSGSKEDNNIKINIGNGTTEGTVIDGVITFKAGTSDTAPIVSVTAPENGWKTGINTFIVSSEKACTVIVKNVDGTYTKLISTTVMDAENTCSFTTDESFSEDCEIIISMTGDINGDGMINQADYLYILSSVRGAGLEGSAALRADINSDGSVSQVDYLYILSAIRGASLSW